jgi:hypothetical protein
MLLNYYLCNYLIFKFSDLLVNKILYFNYDLVIVFDFHMIIYLKKNLHIKVHWFTNDNYMKKKLFFKYVCEIIWGVIWCVDFEKKIV